ncbi:hypothetical protein [Streptomyces sp. NPDC006193]|uniref:hypothetical protein n=1 Tax=Streptomyces sp. NPDC006193 TaxID=3155717 RepID=UPI0033AFB678
MTAPSRRPEHPESPAPHRTAAAPPPAQRPPAPREPRLPQPRQPRRPRAGLPVPAPAVPAAPDVCALGRQFGGWGSDDPEATVCEQAYGQ